MEVEDNTTRATDVDDGSDDVNDTSSFQDLLKSIQVLEKQSKGRYLVLAYNLEIYRLIRFVLSERAAADEQARTRTSAMATGEGAAARTASSEEVAL